MTSKDEAYLMFDAKQKQRQRKMLNINVAETSGVDLPAHMQPGWAVLKGTSNPLNNPRSPESIKARQQAAADRIKERQQQARARQAGAKAVEDPNMRLFEDMVKTLMEKEKLTRAQAISRLADKKPDLVFKAEKARQTKVDSDRAAAAVAKAEEPQTATERLTAEGQRLWREGRAKSAAQGFVMAMEFYPELSEASLNDSRNRGTHFVGE